MEKLIYTLPAATAAISMIRGSASGGKKAPEIEGPLIMTGGRKQTKRYRLKLQIL